MMTASRAHPDHRRRGFAVLVAVVMISLIGIAMLSLTSLLGADAKRTGRHTAETQLRQWLIAGAVHAVGSLEAEPGLTGEYALAIPEDMPGTEIVLSYETENPGQLKVRVRVRMDDYRAEQVLHFSPSGDGWAPTAALITRYQ